MTAGGGAFPCFRSVHHRNPSMGGGINAKIYSYLSDDGEGDNR
jgi:hypothetical protein